VDLLLLIRLSTAFNEALAVVCVNISSNAKNIFILDNILMDFCDDNLRGNMINLSNDMIN
jgi:hypothetical protein